MANDEQGLGANNVHLDSGAPLADKWTETTTPSRVLGGAVLTDSDNSVNIDIGAIAQKLHK